MDQAPLIDMLLGMAAQALDLSEKMSPYQVYEVNMALSLIVRAYKTLVLEYAKRSSTTFDLLEKKSKEERKPSLKEENNDNLQQYSLLDAISLIVALELDVPFPDSLMPCLQDESCNMWEESWSAPCPVLPKEYIIDFWNCTVESFSELTKEKRIVS